MKKTAKENIFFSVIVIVFVALILAFITSCVTEKKVRKHLIDNPELLNEICPKIDTTHKTGVKITVTDKTDSIVKKYRADSIANAELYLFLRTLDSLTFEQKRDSILKYCREKEVVKEIEYKTRHIEKLTWDSIIVSDKVKEAQIKRDNDAIGFKAGYKEGNKFTKIFKIIAIVSSCISLLLILLIIAFFRFKKKI